MEHEKRGEMRVLIVDDEPTLADLAAEFLEQEDDRISVQTVASASEGLEHLGDPAVDCVISDYDMPGQNGIEFLETVREIHPDLPFILFTGKGSETVASEAISAGVTDYLQKQTGADQYTLLANRVANAVERYRGQKQLAEAEDRYRTLFDEMNEGGALHELITDEAGEPIDYELLDVNRAFESILGIPKESAKGKRATDLFETEDPPYLDRYATVAQTGDSIEFETYHPGLEKYFHIAAFSPAQGQFATLFSDITDRKTRERHLEQFKKSAEHAGHAVYITDTEGTIEYVNPAFEAITGYAGEAAIGKTPSILKSGEMSDEYYEELWETVLGGGTWEEEVTNRRQNGELYHAHQTIAPVLDEDDEVEAFVAIQTDISEWKEREEELALFQQLMDESNALIFVGDAETGELVYANRTASEKLGYPKSELLEKHVHEIETAFDSYEEWAAHLDDVREQGRLRFEGLQERKDGSTVPVEVNLSTVDLDTEYVVAIARDITERLERERELELQNERLDEFASVVSHDLRNPLNVAQGRLDLAREASDSEHLEEASSAIDRSLELIENMLSLARAGKQVREMESVDVASLVETSGEHVETGEVTIVSDLDSKIRADRSRLRQLMGNLIRNSVEHGGEEVTVTVGQLENGFYVEDDGPGIPAEIREDVFETGYSTREEGTGFGLSIVTEIVEAHDWEIRVTEGSDGGARFEITGVNVESA